MPGPVRTRPAVEALREDTSKTSAGKTRLDHPGEPFRLGGDWALNPAQLLHLQRLAGNATVAALVGRVQREALPADVVAQEPLATAPADPVVDIVLDIVDAASPLVGTPQGQGIWDLIRRQFTNRSARSAKASKDTGAAAAFRNALYDKGLASRINKLKKAQKQKALEHIFSALGAAADVKQVKPGTTAGTGTLADEFTELKKTALGDYVKSEGSYADIRTGLLGAFGALEVGTAQALKNAQDYYGTMVPVSTFIEKSLGWTAHVHPDMAAAIGLAEQKLNAVREEKGAQMNPRAASWWFKGVQDSLNNFGDGVSIRTNANNALELSLHSYGWAIDVNASVNPNIPGFPRALVKEITGTDVFVSSGGQSEGNFARGKTTAGVRDEAQRLKDASTKFAGAFADEGSLKQAMLRVINGRLSASWTNKEIDLIYPLVMAALDAGKDKKKQAEKAAARAAALDAVTDQIRGLQDTVGPAVALRAGQFQRADLAGVLLQMGGLYQSSFTTKVNKKTGAKESARVKAEARVTNMGTIAAHGFMNLDPDLVGALAGSDGGKLNWLGAVDESNTKDFMHFELATRPSLYPTVQRKVSEQWSGVEAGSWNEKARRVTAEGKEAGNGAAGALRIPVEGIAAGHAGTEDEKMSYADPNYTKGMEKVSEATPETPGTEDAGRAIVIVPPNIPRGPVDVMLHLHGHTIGYRQPRQLGRRETPPPRDVEYDRIAQQLLESKLPMVAILPQGSISSVFGPGGQSGLDASGYVAEVFELASLKNNGLTPGRVMLSGWSGGGKGIAEMIEGSNPDIKHEPKKQRIKDSTAHLPDEAKIEGLVLFDAVYGWQLETFSDWLRRKVDADVDQIVAQAKPGMTGDAIVAAQKAWIQTSGFRFRDYYTDGCDTCSDKYLADVTTSWIPSRKHINTIAASYGPKPGRKETAQARSVLKSLQANYQVLPAAGGTKDKVQHNQMVGGIAKDGKFVHENLLDALKSLPAP